MYQLYLSFLERLSAQLLWQITGLVAVVLLLMSIYILIRMRLNHRKEQRRSEIRQEWNSVLAELLMNEQAEDQEPELPARLWQALKKPFVRRVVTSELVRTQASLRGQMNSVIVQLYNKLQLHEVSVSLLFSRQWHRKAKGIQQLSSMGQYQVAELIVAYTNHPHVAVRSEAQVGMVRLEGPQGLRFLNTLRQPLSEWQQFNLLHELQLHKATDITGPEQWLQSANASVVVFAIRLCRQFQLFDFAPQIQQLLHHTQTAVRVESRQCLITWGLLPSANMEQPVLEFVLPEKLSA